MYNGYRRRHRMESSGDDGGLGCLVAIMLAILALPVLGVYLLVKGENDTQRIIGLVIVVLCVIGMITGG